MIGIDVGGANLKVVDNDGVHIHYCPLWQEAPIKELLSPYAGSENAAVVMSGELADCFSSKQEGIGFIVSEVQTVFPDAIFYGMDGRFHTSAVPELAAANWLAMADMLKSRYPDAVLVDMGSTTTDIIPLNAFDSMIGQTDLTRLQQGYLVYCGLLRTNVATLIHNAEVSGINTPVSTEYFASTGDVYIALNRIEETLFSADTADRKGTDRTSCLRRLARVVCADLEEIGESGALDVARSVYNVQMNLIGSAVQKVVQSHNAEKIITVGIGSGLVAEWTGGRDLSADLGEYTDAMPAYAVKEKATSLSEADLL
ncbi:hydantoinase/oxoprolinase family protein [Methanospirillum lacunae]|uniref:H4MPT-linked C1 transfer pathway protein n=1 Tax=Methanospirillum lacunae TaxID=668570 RepID=A0A2V2N820_9EURY|nr:hydantoinase/oxoprolinase family protein [Methanospirillum lacunae]PWR73846.1 H4MPT-linked C1 transfer pathway protein [Methanospirillum lacunae]